MRLENKKVMIIGGGSEMAATIGRYMLLEGAELFLVDLSMPRMQKFADANPEFADKIHMATGNVCSLEELQKAADDMTAAVGRIDSMVFVAGIIRHNPIDVMPDEDWKAVIDVNLTGCYHAVKAVVPQMKKQQYGHIVLISSIGGRTSRACGSNYAASKAGIIGMVKNLSLELAPSNITVNSIAPGPLRGEMFDTMDPERIRILESGIPLGRVGTMDDVAPAVVFAASDEAAWMTGEVIDINGGLYT